MGIGSGYSNTLTVYANTYPTSMTTPTLTAVHPYNITVSWSALTSTANGGDLPIFYKLEWYDYTLGWWVALNTYGVDPLVFTYTHVRGSIFSPSL